MHLHKTSDGYRTVNKEDQVRGMSGKKADARTFGQDLMRGEHKVGEGKSGAGERLTWVAGDRENLDETSRKILASGAQRRSGVNGPWTNHPRYYEQKGIAEGHVGRRLTNEEFERDWFKIPESEAASGTSIFDPVLCELAYRWFCPPSGLVLDPFAGGSVRGIVASKLGRKYVGIDLRPEQIAENRAQADSICSDPMPVWHVGDSRKIAEVVPDIRADFVFSCPPYADLERYSDDPLDLSTLAYTDFRREYEAIIERTISLLKPDRFACFVVGDVRDKRGFYYGFPGHTVEAFEAAGARLYNEAILVTAVGSLSIRVGKQFTVARKLGKTHQQVYVFCKGDPRKATQAIGEVEFGDIPTDGEPTKYGEPL